MSNRQKLISLCPVVLVLAGGLLWHLSAADKGKAPTTQSGKLQIAATTTLGGADRYLTYLSTDKPIYRPGEKIYLRGVVLHATTNQPLATNFGSMVEVKGPKGDTVASGWVNSEDSVIGFAWDIPKHQAGGEYIARVTHPGQGHAPAERKFDIRAYRAPRLKSQIKFLRDGYGPGDQAAATLHVERAEGGIPAGAKVTIVARVDGQEAFRGNSTVNDAGDCVARFQLPDDIRRGEGTLAMIIEDGGIVETASKTIPILLQTVDLTMYPEGGDLIGGLENRVYFEAFTPAKKPADLAGVVLDADGKEVAKFRSQHEGRGRFTLTPKTDGQYVLKITEPAGINTQYPLPQVKPNGVVLSSPSDVTGKGEKVELSIGSAKAGDYTVTLSQREQVIAKKSVKLDAGKPQQFQFDAKAEGVLIATAWDSAGKPLAERLIFRQPAKSIHVKITADAKRYTPGGKAKVTVDTRDANGKPISAVVGITVTDDSVLEMIEKREQTPRLPVMVLLENDVRELADAHVYLDQENEKAPLAVDLLLGTQGWRRFAFVNTAEFIGQHGDLARRVLALRMSTHAEVRTLAEAKFDGALPQAAAPVKKAKGAPVPEKAPAEPNNEPDKSAAPEPNLGDIDPKPAPPAPADRPNANAKPRGGQQEGQKQDEQKNRQGSQPGGKREAADAKRLELNKALEKVAANGRRRKLLADEEFAGGPRARNDFIAFRVYAHEVRKNRKPGERTDFTETLFWHAGIKTNEKGRATVEFGLNDSVTSFRVFADAFGSDGGLGSEALQIESVEPFYLEPKLPLEVTAGDRIQLPIGLVNATDSQLGSARFTAVSHPSLDVASPPAPFDLAPEARVRRLIDITVGQHNGKAEFTLRAAAGPYGDKVTRTLTVKPQGFPIEFGRGGLITPGDTVSHEITIPDNLVPKSLSSRVVVYPTPLASLTEALEGLIRQPCGCFEQTSSSTYPLVMAQQYFMSHQGVDPSIVERSSQILTTGYERLIGFECKGGGYEWFGKDPGHDALTAYGLLEFTDMSQVRHVDPAMLDRTRKWLLTQRDGKGNYPRKTHTYHVWLPDPEIANSYNTWALLEAGVKEDLSTEVAWIREAAEKTQNTYVMALAANVLALAGDKEGENHLLDKLSGKQSDDGSLTGATRSVVGSGGQALAIETTALAVMAWLKNDSYAPNVEKSIKFLAESCKSGRFGSTQSTVLALRAIVAYDKSRAKPKSPGNLQLLVDGKPVGNAITFDKDTQGAIELPAFSELLAAGEHQIQVKMTDGSKMPYSVAIEYNALKPASAKECQLHLQVRLRDKQIDEGAATEAEVVVVNRTNEDVPTPIAIIGIPGGLEVRHDQLKELVKAERIAAYEVIGREVVLYWRALKAEERVELPISLIAAIPGTYTGPASRAYLYYTDEYKNWADGLNVEISPKQ